jgi:GGDEF domain-containing protein
VPGNAPLHAVARRLTECVRNHEDVWPRLGADDIAIALRARQQAEDAPLPHRILLAVNASCPLADLPTANRDDYPRPRRPAVTCGTAPDAASPDILRQNRAMKQLMAGTRGAIEDLSYVILVQSPQLYGSLAHGVPPQGVGTQHYLVFR